MGSGAKGHETSGLGAMADRRSTSFWELRKKARAAYCCNNATISDTALCDSPEVGWKPLEAQRLACGGCSV